MYKDLLEYIAKNLVQNPDQISIEETENESKKILKIKVAKEDMGRIIGKDGRIIRAIREIILSYGMKEKIRVSVEVEEQK